MGQEQIPAPGALPDGLYFHARDIEAARAAETTQGLTPGESAAKVHGHRRSQNLADVFARLDRLRGAVKQLRYMDETGHIDQVVPHIRARAAVVFADMDALLADVDEAVARWRGPETEPAPVNGDLDAAAKQWYPVDDPPADSRSNIVEVRTVVPSPRDMVAEVNDAALARRRAAFTEQSQLRWSTQGGGQK